MTSISEKTAEGITSYLKQKGGLNSEEEEICRYGFDVLIYSFMQLALLVTIGVIVQKPTETIIYLAVSLSLRRYTGGFHARTRLGCNCTSCVLLGIVLTVMSFCSQIFSYLVTYPLCIVFYFICFMRYVPVEHKNKPLSEMQKHTYKRRALIVSIVWLMIAVIAKFLNMQMGDVVVFSMVIVAISVVIALERRQQDG